MLNIYKSINTHHELAGIHFNFLSAKHMKTIQLGKQGNMQC